MSNQEKNSYANLASIKYRDAVNTLATLSDNLEERLFQVFSHDIGFIDAQMLPQDLKEKHEELLGRASSKKMQGEGEKGIFGTTLGSMTDDERKQLARDIVDLAILFEKQA